MNCREIEPLLYLVRQGETTTEERREIDLHLATCGNCKKIFDSVTRMAGIVSSQYYEGGTKFKMANTETIIRLIEQEKANRSSKLNLYRYWPYIRGLAAGLLVLFSSVLLYEEIDFYNHRSAMKIPLQKEDEFFVSDSREVDCLVKLKRKYRIKAFFLLPHDESLVMNRISEEQLTRYIEQVCGSEGGDISKVKKLLIQAGLIKSGIYSEIKK
jgi:hypothetical protein